MRERERHTALQEIQVHVELHAVFGLQCGHELPDEGLSFIGGGIANVVRRWRGSHPNGGWGIAAKVTGRMSHMASANGTFL